MTSINCNALGMANPYTIDGSDFLNLKSGDFQLPAVILCTVIERVGLLAGLTITAIIRRTKGAFESLDLLATSICGYSSVVERHLAKVNVARSNRVTRFEQFCVCGSTLLVELQVRPYLSTAMILMVNILMFWLASLPKGCHQLQQKSLKEVCSLTVIQERARQYLPSITFAGHW